MGLSAGTHLGPYEILAPLGAGGMGEVWRARDGKLGRDVALKLLPDAFAGDAERLSRFRREAQVMASLNHPNIGAIHGLEESNGTPFLTLELVEGEDLAKRLARGAVPREEALDVAKQIAEALEEAHAKGVVHRDLKPANVKITPQGRVKVLDFGLAKALRGEPAEGTAAAADITNSPTLARPTEAGMILGTAAYMAPEQAAGRPVDRRADIWSFGVVVFEMLTGRPLFVGGTPSEILASVIKDEPAWDRLPPDCPPAVVRLLRRCLRKRVHDRLQDIGDARVEIGDVMSGATDGEEAGGGRPSARKARGFAWLPWTLALVSTVAALLVAFRERTREPGAPVRFVLDTPEGATLGDFTLPAFAPDGRSVVFGSTPFSERRPSLWLRRLESPEARELPGTENGLLPFWSPDGASIAFFSSTEGLRRLRLSDGSMQTIGPGAPHLLGLTWGEDGTILFGAGGNFGRLYSVPAAGGEPRILASPDTSLKETGYSWPQFLPGGRRFLFVVSATDPESAGVYVSSLDAPREKKRVLPLDARAVYASGHLLYVRGDVLEAQPIDETSLAPTGTASRIAQRVGTWSQRVNRGWFSASTRGHLAYLSVGADARTRLEWRDRAGRTVGTVGSDERYGQIGLSPDGRQIVAEILDSKGSVDLWVLDVARGVPSRVTVDPANEGDPVWSTSGREVIFGSDRESPRSLYRKSLDGGRPESPLLETVNGDYPESFSPDGKTLLFLTEDTRFPRVIKTVWSVSMEPRAEPRVVLKTGFDLDEPHISPDARWLTYTSDESGSWEVYVQAYGRPGERVRVSTEGGGQPRWRGDGKELFYLARDGRLMSVAVRGGADSVDVALPTILFDSGAFRPDYDDYAPSADGQRFLVKVRVTTTDPPRIHVLLDWPAARPGGE